jgi:hypothetical protein
MCGVDLGFADLDIDIHSISNAKRARNARAVLAPAKKPKLAQDVARNDGLQELGVTACSAQDFEDRVRHFASTFPWSTLSFLQFIGRIEAEAAQRALSATTKRLSALEAAVHSAKRKLNAREKLSTPR